MSPLLEIEGLTAAYGPIRVLHGLHMTVDTEEVVVLLGANGAGKTTLMRSICQLPPVNASGRVCIDGTDVMGAAPGKIVKRGIALVPQGRGTFADLTVAENLEIGAYTSRSDQQADIERWYSAFPRLAERRDQLAGSLSGGEQQMLAICRALMSRPRLLLLDEPSMGLAPMIARDVFEELRKVNDELGTAMLIVEQAANLALSIADRGYVLANGRITTDASADELRATDAVRRAYLGA